MSVCYPLFYLTAKLSPTFQNIRQLSRGAPQKELFSKIMWYNIALLHLWSKTEKSFIKIYSKLHSIAGIFEKDFISSSELQYRKLYLDGCFREQSFFWEYSWRAASQMKLGRYIYFKSSNGHVYFVFLTVTSC